MEKAEDHHQLLKAANSETKYKGVRKRKWGKWVSEIRLPNSRDRIWLGSYDHPEKAARAFDAALFCLRGPRTSFNFPDKTPSSEILGLAAHRPRGQLSHHDIQEAAARFANQLVDDENNNNNTNNNNVPRVSHHELILSHDDNNNIYAAASSSTTTASATEHAVDWSFLESMEYSGEVHGCLSDHYDHGFCFCSNYDHNNYTQSDDQIFARPPPASPVENGGQNFPDHHFYHDQSFLWNFDN